MFTNYLKIAFRNLWNHKLFSFINIFGMAVAVGVSLLLFLTAFNQFSFDRFHVNGENIYRVYLEEYYNSGIRYMVNMPVPLLPAVLDEIPEIDHAVRWHSSGASVEYNGELYRESIRYTDADFFSMFSFPLLKGNPEKVLNDLNNIVISEEVATKIFGEEDPIDKTIRINVEGSSKDLVVAGVVSNHPSNSSLRYNIITRYENHPNYAVNKQYWDNMNHSLYVALPENISQSSLQESFKNIAHKYFQWNIEQVNKSGATPDVEGEVLRFKLQPLHDIHFDTSISGRGISKAFPLGLVIIAAFILLIACINFVNLTLGSSVSRAREVGVRKVLGANRSQLLAQFWGEAFLVIGISLIVGTALAQWLVPGFNSSFNQSLSLNNSGLFLALGSILVFASLIGGGYPGVVISRFQAAEVLKGSASVQKPGKLRNLLVVVQFALSVLLITCTIIVYQQIEYLQNKPLGFNEEEVISIPIGNEMNPNQLLSRFRNELAAYPAIKNITASYTNLGMGKDGSRSTSIMGFEHQGQPVKTNWNRIDYDYFETLEIPLVEGRPFSRDHPSDSIAAAIINETFAKQLSDSSMIGQKLSLDQPLEVIGVAKDFHFKSLTSEIGPLTFVLGGNEFRLSYIFVRLESTQVAQTINQIEKVWKSINPKATFEASFLNENTDRLYRAESMMGKLFISAAVLAIILSCMGLFGIALLVIVQRTKEIGIRKVLGASVGNIVQLISVDFMKMVLIAIIIASPLAWWAMSTWLGTYAYGVKIHWWVFILSGLLAALIALITLSLQSVRAATSSPVKALRSE